MILWCVFSYRMRMGSFVWVSRLLKGLVGAGMEPAVGIYPDFAHKEASFGVCFSWAHEVGCLKILFVHCQTVSVGDTIPEERFCPP